MTTLGNAKLPSLKDKIEEQERILKEAQAEAEATKVEEKQPKKRKKKK